MPPLLQRLKTQPWFLLLIPVFFVLHGVRENLGFIPFRDAALLAGVYVLATAIVFGLFLLLYRHLTRASLPAAFLMMVYLFFGAYHDFLLSHIPALGKYSVLLLLLLAVFIALLIIIRKRTAFEKPMLLLNLVFALYVLIDGAGIIAGGLRPPTGGLQVANSTRLQYHSIPTAKKADIYLLVFDEYASSASLQACYGYHNDLDAWLRGKGFSIQPGSYSNYNLTPASVASLLNMSYISGIQDSVEFSVKDLNNCIGLIRDNETTRFLSREGYDIVNCSPFDLDKHPAPAMETLLPLKTRLISSNTLLSRMHRDLGWMLYKGRFQQQWLMDMTFYEADEVNGKLLRLLKEQAGRKKDRPVFVYGHLYLPHAPYLRDRNGRLKSKGELLNPAKDQVSNYLDYLEYTNREIKKLVDTLQLRTGGRAAIILMGDHGLRLHFDKPLHRYYQNMNAVYLPGGDYHRLYDSITCVNQLREVFNNLFDQSLPRLKDSSIFLVSKQ